MAGLVPAIHDFFSSCGQDVDARDKPGHDEQWGAHRLTLKKSRSNVAASVSPTAEYTSGT